jgi:hypothetical protein
LRLNIVKPSTRRRRVGIEVIIASGESNHDGSEHGAAGAE